MRIAFIGKGGSGKSTAAALFASAAANAGIHTLVIDADVNQHVGLSLGIPPERLAELRPIGNHAAELRTHVRGENSRIADPAHIVKSTPPAEGSRFVRLADAADPVLSRFTLEHNGIRLLLAGEFEEEELGTSCYHKYTGAVQILLNHLDDPDGTFVVADMTAGIDGMGSGLFQAFDAAYLVVEPTVRSATVFEQYRTASDGSGVELLAIGNKVADERDAAFLAERLGSHLVGTIGVSEHVRAFERGEISALAFDALQDTDAQVFAGMVDRHRTARRDHAQHVARMHALHRKMLPSLRAWNADVDWEGQIDEAYSPV